MKDKVEGYRHLVVETAAESDVALLEKYPGGEELTPRRSRARSAS
jgi:hypothetical protein